MISELVFFDITFEDSMGNTYEITTMDIDGDNEFKENILSKIQR